MKTSSTTLILIIMLFLSSCANEINQTKVMGENEIAFLRGESQTPITNSYIMNGKKHHPFLFSDQLEVVKDESVSLKEKSNLVFQVLSNHVETYGIVEADYVDFQRLILYLYGPYATIDKTLEGITNDQHSFYLDVLIASKAIDFKYLAKISKYIDSNNTYVLSMSREYLDKYEKIILEKDLDTSSRYGAHCHNIINGCTIAINLLQDS